MVHREITEANKGQDIDHRRQLPIPLLLTAADAAALTGKSLRTWRTWNAAGLIPKPIRIGRSTLWRTDELRAWVAAGCPCRKLWEARQSMAGSQ